MSGFTSLRPLIRSLPRVASSLRPTLRQTIRNNSTSAAPASKSSSSVLLVGLGAAAIGAGAYYTFGGQTDPTAIKDAAMPEQVDYQAVYNAIADALDSEDYDDGSYGPVLVRLAWHCSGSYDKESNSGGSNGATMRFAPEANLGANAGLQHAREKLEPIKKMFPQITYSDLWTLAGVVAIQEMGGPYIQWRAGRKDGDVSGCSPDGRLPDGDKGADHIRTIFYRMGFSDQEIVALSGAHALGRCHTDRSGFENAWSFSPTTMTNDYFKLLLSEKWNLRKWKGPIQYEDTKTKSIMMLTTDHSLITDKVFKPITTLYAKDEAKFFSDFALAFAKLIELGVPTAQFSQVVTLRKTEDQEKIKA